MTDTITDTDVYEKTIAKLQASNTRLQGSLNMWQEWHRETYARLSKLQSFIINEIEAGEMPLVHANLQSKIARQRKALDILNKRVRGQRLHLRAINELGRELSVEEWAEAKAKYPEMLQETPTS